MQDSHELGARLGLADPERLFLTASSDVDGNEIQQAIVNADMTHHDRQLPVSETQKLHILKEAGRSLIRQEDLLESAIHLTRFADPTLSNTAELAQIRLHALRRLGRTEELLEDAERILQSADAGSRSAKIVRDSLRKWNMERRIPVDTKYLPAYFPDPEVALQRPFASALPEGPYSSADAIGPVIAALQGRDPEDLAFLQRVRWGAQAHRQMVFLNNLRRKILKKPDHDTEEQFALELYEAHRSRIAPLDTTDVMKEIEAGKSVVLAEAHAGMSIVQNYGLPFGPTPFSIITRGGSKARRPQDFHFSSLGQHVPRDLAKLVKLMRKDPRIVRIFPDGPHGEGSPVSLCGRSVRIGRGGAAIAYSGKASVFFPRTVWDGEQFNTQLQRGPSAPDYASKEAFEQAFNDFYAAQLTAIIMGAPEDMAPAGGFWLFLRS
jgi:hypothetical protein